jgi:hypothetical protein
MPTRSLLVCWRLDWPMSNVERRHCGFYACEAGGADSERSAGCKFARNSGARDWSAPLAVDILQIWN